MPKTYLADTKRHQDQAQYRHKRAGERMKIGPSHWHFGGARATPNDRLRNVSRSCQGSLEAGLTSHFRCSLRTISSYRARSANDRIGFFEAATRFRDGEPREREPWTGIRKHGVIASSCRAGVWKTRVARSRELRSECYTGAIMTVPPELPPGTLRCSAFLVGMDRTAAAIPFSSDVACYPRVHVSESGDEPTDVSRGCCTRPALCTRCIVRCRERLYRRAWGILERSRMVL